tara:strand:- start:325 stop:522 length:198 start_codon:yes stop_codon:yes gene_type:complete
MGSVTFFAPSIPRKAPSTDFVHRGVKAVKSWLQRRREHAQLAAMSDHQLKDIGLTRGDVFRELNS